MITFDFVEMFPVRSFDGETFNVEFENGDWFPENNIGSGSDVLGRVLDR